MEIRTKKPGSNDKWYIRKASGGWSTCIAGNPKDKICDVLSNCVGYACGRFNEIYSKVANYNGMKFPSLNCNAENFIERAQNTYGLKISNVPVVGGIMVWQRGDTLKGSDGAGHVAIVEKIIDENTIYTSESSYSGTAFFNATRSNTNGRWGMGAGNKFRGCIINPAIGDVHYVEPVAVDPFPNVSDEELAKRVWNGDFGNGDDRKNALGIRYNNVQALVNNGVGKPEEQKPIPTPQPAPEIDMLDLVRKTIRGDFGNGVTRKQNLGSNYAEVQRQVNLNVQHGLTRWDNIKLF